MLQAQVSGEFTTNDQALKCRICGKSITNPKEKSYLSAGTRRGRAVHKHCKAKVKKE